MEVRRKAVAACAVAATLAAIAGCGDDGESEKASAGAKPDRVRVAVVMASLDNDFYVAQKEGVEAEAAKQPGAEVTVSAGRQRSSTDEVIGLIEDAMTKGVDAIAVNGSDTKPLLPVLERVIDGEDPAGPVRRARRDR